MSKMKIPHCYAERLKGYPEFPEEKQYLFEIISNQTNWFTCDVLPISKRASEQLLERLANLGYIGREVREVLDENEKKRQKAHYKFFQDHEHNPNRIYAYYKNMLDNNPRNKLKTPLYDF